MNGNIARIVDQFLPPALFSGTLLPARRRSGIADSGGRECCFQLRPRKSAMSISQVLFDAVQTLEAELQKPGEYGELLHKEIADLVHRMKIVQQKLDVELTEIDTGDPS